MATFSPEDAAVGTNLPPRSQHSYPPSPESSFHDDEFGDGAVFELPTLFTLVYVLLAEALFFLYAYPFVRDLTRDVDTSGVVALCGTLMCTLFLLVFLFSAWIGLLAFLFLMISLVSGIELILWTRTRKINVALFVFCVALSIFRLLRGDVLGQVAYLVQGVIWMMGIGLATNKHLLPAAKSLLDGYGDESPAESFAAICLILCVVTILAPLSGAEFPWWMQSFRMMSDVGFLVGGSLAYVSKKKGILLLPLRV